MKKSKKTKHSAQHHTLCIPRIHAREFAAAYAALRSIDCNFSRLVCVLLGNIVPISKIISFYTKNYRHYNWHIIIEDKETGKIITHLNLEIKEKKDEVNNTT